MGLEAIACGVRSWVLQNRARSRWASGFSSPEVEKVRKQDDAPAAASTIAPAQGRSRKSRTTTKAKAMLQPRPARTSPRYGPVRACSGRHNNIHKGLV